MERSLKTSPSHSIILSVLAAIPAIVALKIEGFAWLLYLCGIILLLNISSFVWDLLLAKIVKKTILSITLRKHLKSNFEEYLMMIEKFRILEDLESALSSSHINWKDKQPPSYCNIGNTLGSVKNNLNIIPLEHRIIATNVMFIEIVRSFDRWLYICDGMLRQGEAHYKNEESQNKVIRLADNYHRLTITHDDFCKLVNTKLRDKDCQMIELYCQAHDFNWKKAEPRQGELN
ncbi:hypothetical protein [Agarilytica rhodophyticola]|uniref:hypothetical protein n=1 Tax=Agarilytica rhodophyticola TaxID=1737490 RepID=UPI000CD8C5B0|nr:hypothetical protein [Agarilytica rhodophyticola]